MSFEMRPLSAGQDGVQIREYRYLGAKRTCVSEGDNFWMRWRESSDHAKCDRECVQENECIARRGRP